MNGRPGMIRLSALHVYPLKSAAGISAGQWAVDEFGLRHDRRWMVVDAAGRHVTQRTHPRLALVRPTIDGHRLRLTAPDQPVLEVPLEPRGDATASVTVWGDTCAAHWMGGQADRWFCRALETTCRLVYMPDTTLRPVDSVYAPPGARVSFADGFPFLLISEESLADLNQRLRVPVPMNRFRPNLVLAGGEPYLEDHLDTFRLGEVVLRVVKSCARCVLTTVDQITTQRGREPLRTLATYRRVGGEVMFGQNVVHSGTGLLRVGAPVVL